MIRINLLEEAKAKKGKGAKVAVAAAPGGPPPFLIPLGIGLLALTLAGMFGWWYQVKSTADKLAQDNVLLKKQVDEKEPFLAKAKEMETRKNELNSRIEQIQALKAQQQGPVYLMKRLYEIKPEGVWFIKVGVTDPATAPAPAAPAPKPGSKGGAAQPAAAAAPAAPAPPPNSNISIQGRGLSQTMVTQFITQLEQKKDWFPRVTLKSIKAVSDSEAGLEGREFELDVEFAQPMQAGVRQ